MPSDSLSVRTSFRNAWVGGLGSPPVDAVQEDDGRFRKRSCRRTVPYVRASRLGQRLQACRRQRDGQRATDPWLTLDLERATMEFGQRLND